MMVKDKSVRITLAATQTEYGSTVNIYFPPFIGFYNNYITQILLHNPAGETQADFYQQMGPLPTLNLRDRRGQALLTDYPFTDLVNALEYEGGTGGNSNFGTFGNTRMFNLFNVDLERSYIRLLFPNGTVFTIGQVLCVFDFIYTNKKPVCQFA